MNYIDPTLETSQVLALNTRAEATDSISWTLTEEGDDSSSISFTSPSANFTLTDMRYFQALSCNFFDEGIDLSSERSYLLRGAVNGSDVYVGKVFVTEQDIDTYEVNNSKYVENSVPNNFVILD